MLSFSQKTPAILVLPESAYISLDMLFLAKVSLPRGISGMGEAYATRVSCAANQWDTSRLV